MNKYVYYKSISSLSRSLSSLSSASNVGILDFKKSITSLGVVVLLFISSSSSSCSPSERISRVRTKTAWYRILPIRLIASSRFSSGIEARSHSFVISFDKIIIIFILVRYQNKRMFIKIITFAFFDEISPITQCFP